jgi:hypothetical protein
MGGAAVPPILSKPSFVVRAALTYITLGAVMVVWTAVWFLYLNRHGGTDPAYFTDYGFFLSGLVLLVIGFTIGRIGRSARHAELPPEVGPHGPTAQPAVTPLPPGFFVPQYPVRGTPPLAAPAQGAAVVPPATRVAPPGPSPR